jgi:hypothetical protein
MKSPALLLGCVIVMAAVHAETSALYDANPEHPWNRLSAALHTDAPLDFAPPGEYEARALTGEPYEKAVKALDDFLKHHSETSIKSPIKRAILQSELWATFDQVSDATGGAQAARREIARRCAAIIKRLALSNAEIAGLPDNYAITLASKEFPRAYDPAQPEKVFLPDDLLVDDPPWIMLSASASEILQPAAIQHVKASQGRAVFYALLRLPGGRQATLAYLKKLAEFPQPYAWNEMYKVYTYARSAVKVNPDLPQFPPGTQAALMRRMVLTNSSGELVVSPITESIQVRVYAKDPHEVQFDTPDAQYFYEMTLLPEELFQGSGGLRARDGEPTARRLTFAKATLFSQPSHCRNCHGGAGVLSLNTYTHAFGTFPNSPWFEPTSATRQDTNTLNWKKRDYTWGLLSALLESR